MTSSRVHTTNVLDCYALKSLSILVLEVLREEHENYSIVIIVFACQEHMMQHGSVAAKWPLMAVTKNPFFLLRKNKDVS